MVDIKVNFNDYFVRKGYSIRESKTLKSENPNLLFNISGGVIFENYIEGKKIDVMKLASIQRCLRTDSWNKIGFSGKHHLFFEMIGHFSFGVAGEYETKSYFIEDSINFLVSVDDSIKENIYLTVHPNDQISKNIVSDINLDYIENKNNTTLSPKKTRSGYRVEIIYKNNQRELELWNLVFTQYDDLSFKKPIKKIIADSGMSVERLLSVIEKKNNNYECSEWIKYIDMLNCKENIPSEYLYRMADLLRTAIELLKDGILPGKKSENYVSRKILRELFSLLIFYKLDVDMVISNTSFFEEFKSEYNFFKKSLEKGKQVMNKLEKNKGFLSTEDKKLLRCSYGYPDILIPK